MMTLFREELRNYTGLLQEGLQAIKEGQPDAGTITDLIRAAHSIKGAARIMQLESIVTLAGTMEESLRAAQKGNQDLDSSSMQALSHATEALQNLLKLDVAQLEDSGKRNIRELQECIDSLISARDKGNPKLFPAGENGDQLVSQLKNETVRIRREFHKRDGDRALVRSSAATLAKLAPNLPHPEVAALGRVVGQALSQFPGKFDPFSADVQRLFERVLKRLQEYCDLPHSERDRWVKESRASINDLTQHFTHQAAPAKEQEESSVSDPQIMRLFFIELETQTCALSDGLLALEANPHDRETLVSLMRCAHSIKGAARVLGINQIVQMAHAMEDGFNHVEKTPGPIDPLQIDLMLKTVDLFSTLAKVGPEDMGDWLRLNQSIMEETTADLRRMVGNLPQAPVVTAIQEDYVKPEKNPEISKVPEKTSSLRRLDEAKQATRIARRDRVLRVTADYLTRLMGLAGELLVESRWLHPFSDALLQLKKSQYELSGIVDIFRASLDERLLGEEVSQQLLTLQQKTQACRVNLSAHLDQLELFIRRHATLSDRLYREVITSRMCPFGEGVEGLPRMVRDLAKQLNKQARLEIIGRSTTIDRDILDKLKAPLNHLIRNSVDHGIETPDERIAKGKTPEGTIRLEARHRAGVLCITVSDDGRGIDLDQVRQQILAKKLIDVDMANQLTEQEILDFLFLPGFSTTKVITDISGRGVGLNIVQTMVHEVSGQVRVTSSPDQGVTFHLQLPLTLSVLRALLVEIAGESYAFPLARIEKAMSLNRNQIRLIENREYLNIEGLNIGLVQGHQVLGLPDSAASEHELSVVVLSENMNYYGLVVDRLLGEKELVVQDLDARLGKLSDISCGAFMEDGSPTLIIDVEDMVRSIDKLLSGGPVGHLPEFSESAENRKRRKKILVVDDSITVREVECRILENQGYEVDVAVNGVDGWNTVRIGDYDLVITDVDMPRMNGIELVRSIKTDSRLKAMPVMIVSYKERSDDRMLGMEAGANYYLAKSSFHDDRFIESVKDLIGEA